MDRLRKRLMKGVIHLAVVIFGSPLHRSYRNRSLFVTTSR